MMDDAGASPPVREGERWADFPGVQDYQISSHGRVWSNPRPVPPSNRMGGGVLLSSAVATGSGAQVVRIRGTQYTIARIVLSAFVRPPKSNERVTYQDGDSTNLRVENLAWALPSHLVVVTEGAALQNLSDEAKARIQTHARQIYTAMCIAAPMGPLEMSQNASLQREYAQAALANAFGFDTWVNPDDHK